MVPDRFEKVHFASNFREIWKFLQIFGNPMVNMNRILRFTMQLAQRTFTREVHFKILVLFLIGFPKIKMLYNSIQTRRGAVKTQLGEVL